jgi:hypothetical protein
MPPMNRSGRVLRRIDSGAPIHEAGIALYRTVMIDREAIRQRWRLFGSKLDECGRRHAAVEARTAGHGGIVAVHEIDQAWFR